MNKYTTEISEKILEYCKKAGFLDKLKKRSQYSESERFDNKNITEEGLDTLDSIECVLDKKRTNSFIEEVVKMVKKGDRVLEAGIGTGILSYIATIKGAEVRGIEVSKDVINMARSIKGYIKNNYSKYHDIFTRNPTFFYKNAISFSSKERFDCIISENLYTGMLYEKQVQIMNNLIKYLNPKGIVIPKKMNSYLDICEISPEIDIGRKSLVVINHLPQDIRDSYRKLSLKQIYSSLIFSNINEKSVKKELKFKIIKKGLLNGVIISSNVYMPSGKILEGSKTAFCINEIIIPLNKKILVEKGDQIKLSISYTYGDNPKNLKIDILKTN